MAPLGLGYQSDLQSVRQMRGDQLNGSADGQNPYR